MRGGEQRDRHGTSSRVTSLVLLFHMPHQAALALDLAPGQFVFTSLVGVAAGLEFDSDGCAAESHGRPESIFQVAFVGGRDTFCLVAMNNNDGRVTPALVCISQLDTTAPDHGWLVFLDNFFQDRG